MNIERLTVEFFIVISDSRHFVIELVKIHKVHNVKLSLSDKIFVYETIYFLLT